MKKSNRTILLLYVILSAAVFCPVAHAQYLPWDNLTADSWISFGSGIYPNMYPVNAPDNNDIAPAYPIAFSQAGGGDKAKGMNALKFVHGPLTEGHLVSRDKLGSFGITNAGDTNTFTTLLVVVTIAADFLPDDFALTLNLRGSPPYRLDPNDFAYYHNPFGRPSGYYSITDPNHDPLTYACETGMVTVYGIAGLSPLPPNGATITLDYNFTDLPAPALFSVYGYIATDPEPTIYHTNKAFLDNNDLAGSKNKISTFAVTIDGDLNGDLRVDLADFVILSHNWLSRVAGI